MALADRLQSSLGTRVDLTKGRKGGRLTIHFYSDEELDALVQRLG
jgi:ParB family chromosome partitioning protein